MITIRLRQSRDGRIVGFSVTGHSGYAEKGADIVCAGVSAVVQTTLLGLQNVVGIDCSGSQADGELHCDLPKNLGDAAAAAADLLLLTMLQGLTALASAYADHIRILSNTLCCNLNESDSCEATIGLYLDPKEV